MSKPDNPIAFPMAQQNENLEWVTATGMTLRDYFAAKAMQGFFANKANPMHFLPDDDAKYAYDIADAMLKAREK